MENKTLSVRLLGEEAGILEQDKNGKIRFTYFENAKTAISHSLPLGKKTFMEKECRPYFNGLLPESEKTRKRIAAIFGINANSDFAILKSIGHDCAGALSLHNPDDPVKKISFVKLEGAEQTEESLAKHIEELPQSPFFMDNSNDIRLSLAGAQDKGAISIIDGKICLPKNGTPSTHILKPLIKELDDTILNEYLCLRLAVAVDITAPKVEIRKAKNIPYLLIERYDRKVKDNKVKRIHQEDFCQALGVLSINKYQVDGGPGIKECFRLLDNTVKVPAKNILALMKMIMLNYLIGNNDAHGKNFSLLYKNEKPVLAPAYDILSTEAYPKLTSKMAMKIGSSYEKEWIGISDWQKMCEAADYSFPVFKTSFLEMCEALPQKLQAEIELLDKGISRDIPNRISEVMRKNIKQIEKVLS